MTTTTATISRPEAEAIRDQIIALKVSRRRQINVEFEGYDSGVELPQERMINELAKSLGEGGWYYLYASDLLWDNADCQESRDRWNDSVRTWMAAHPGQQIPTAEFDSLQRDLGVSYHGVLKPAIEFFDGRN